MSYYIYKICCDDCPDFVYVGSTKSFRNRKYRHKHNCNNGDIKKLYTTIRENGGWDNWRMVILEECGEITFTKARIKEEEYRVKLNANLNSQKCKVDKKEYMKEYYENNKDKRQEYDKEYREKNKDKRQEYDKEYREKNKEKRQEYDKEYYENNKEKKKEYATEYRENNKEKTQEYNKEYYENNKEKIKENKKEQRKKLIEEKNNI